MEIENFYPKFPNVRVLSDSLLNPYSSKFEDAIVTKKEFATLKLPKSELAPEEPGGQFIHQKYISRFMSSFTGYDELLLFHEMGTGKTCTAIACIEKLRYEKDSFVKGALIFAKGNGILKNFVQELLFTCTDGRYVPENYNRLSDLERIHRTKKITSQFYQFFTFETFAKELSQLDDFSIRARYDNHIVVIDEVHNLREREDEEEGDEPLVGKQHERGLNVYKEFERFCHVLERRKILLMSGTPMKDGPEEFASVMNLILPRESQFVTDKQFLKKYFVNDRFDPAEVPDFLNKIRGRVSYLKSSTTEVEKRFVGKKIGLLRHFVVVPDEMGQFQTAAYEKAYALDSQTKSIYTNSRQASLFVFPDGTVGAEGFSQTRYVSKKIAPGGLREMAMGVAAKKRRAIFTIGFELANRIGSIARDGKQRCLSNLYDLSAKYANTIRDILEQDRSKAFVYCQYVNGSGAIVFALILERFGFVAAKGDEQTKQKRYALVTNQTASTKTIQNMINRFNADDNIDGEYIAVVIGSKVINEGFTLKNVRQEFIMTPHWNYGETSQAIARGWRTGSHASQIQRGDTNVSVSVFQRVSLPGGGSKVPSIDLEMYETSEKKDVIIKRVERLVKEISFDCPLAIVRNKVVGYDGQRECDYEDCEYSCSGTIGAPLDSSTYNIYHSIVDTLDKFLKRFFETNFFISIPRLIEKFPDLEEFEIAQALSALVNRDAKYVNKYGFPNFVRVQGETLYITSDPKTGSSAELYLMSLGDYYAKNLIVENGDSFSQLIDDMYDETLPDKIQSVFDHPQYARTMISALPESVQRAILEGCVIAKMRGTNKNVAVRDDVLDFFKGFYGTIDDTPVIWLHSDEIGTVCYDSESNSWLDCEIPEEKKYVKKAELQQSPIGYYGLYNPKLKDFCIRDLHRAKEVKDLRKLSVGRRCIDWEHERLVGIVARSMKIDAPLDFLVGASREELESMLTTYAAKKPSRSKYNFVEDDDFENESAMKRVLYWSKQMRKNICESIREWFSDRGLIEENFDCGHQKKRREKFL